MGLFSGLGRSAAAFAPNNVGNPMAAAAPKRRGLFGGLGQRLPEILQTVGAGLQQMDGGSELTDYLAGRRENAQQDALMNEHKQDRTLAMEDRAQAEADRTRRAALLAQQQQASEAYISSLPPAQQAQARVFLALDPEGFVRQMMRNQFPTPTRARSAAAGAPDLPQGFQWED